MSFPGLYRAIKEMVRDEVLQTQTARSIMRKSGFRGGLAVSGEATILSLEGSKRFCFTPNGGVWPGDMHWAIDSGKAYVWGFNYENAFGNPASRLIDAALSPVRSAQGIEDAQKIVGLIQGTQILRSDNTVWVSHLPGSLSGVQGHEFELWTEDVIDISGYSEPSVGAFYVLKEDGTVWAQGDDLVGQGPTVGFPYAPDGNHLYQLPTDVVNDVVQIECGFRSLAWRQSDGTIGTWAFDDADPTFPTLSFAPDNVLKMKGNAFGVHVLTDAGEIWATGGNQRGEYGNSTFSLTDDFTVFYQADGTGYTDVAGSNGAVFATKGEAGELYSWGLGGYLSGRGALAPNASTPTQITSPHLDGWVSVSGFESSFNGFATRDDGCVYVWGIQAAGELGQGYGGTPYPEEPIPLLVGEGFPQLPSV